METLLTALSDTLSGNSLSQLQRLEFLVNTSPAVLFTCEATGNFPATFVSEGVESLWGYSPEEFLEGSELWSRNIHPEDAERFLTSVDRILKTGQHSQEYRFRTKSGEYRWMHDEVRLVRDSAGNPKEFVGYCVDVTERKVAEAALRESEARLALIFNSISDLQILFRVESDNRFVTEAVNRAFCESIRTNAGKNAKEFVGKDFEELLAATGLTPEEIEQRRTFYIRAIQENQTVRFDSPASAAREAVEVAVSPVVDRSGHCTHVLWTGRTITERLKAEAALSESEERYALVTEATLDGIFDWNLQTGDSHLSQRFKEILGYCDDELPNDPSSFFGRIHPDDLAGLNRLLVRSNAEQAIEMFEHEVRLRCKDGSYCWVASRGQVFRDAGGLPVRFIGAIHDITGQKRTEDAVAFLASIVQSSDDSIVGTGLDGRILSWNAGSERFWGYTANEVLGKHIRILYPRDRVREFANNVVKLDHYEPIERFETIRARKDGTRVAVSMILSPIKDAHGKLLGVSAIYRDITKSKEAEARLLSANQAAEASAASLRASEERYALVTEASYDGIFDWNLVTGESYLSPRFNDILGFADGELPNGPSAFFDRVHPEDRERVRAKISDNSADSKSDILGDAVRVRCKDGTCRWVASRGRTVRGANGQPVRIIGSIRDITERMEAEERLAASEKRLRDILDSIFGFVGLYTLDGILIDCNRAPLEAAGVRREDVVGKPFWEASWWSHTSEEKERLREMMGRAARGEVVRYDSYGTIEGGRQMITDTIFGPLRDQQGRITSVLGFGVDITARKEAETKLLLAKQMAEVASRAKSEFLANMSHEIRTPMNGIIGLTEVVLESELNAEQREYLNLVKSSADSLMTIIGDILEISKIQAGRFVLQPKEFWLRDLVSGAVNGFAAAAGEKNLRLTCHIHPTIPEVLLGDSGCLKQVLVNLLGNAIKFTATGEIAVSVEPLAESADLLRFSVRDTGIGIPADQQRMIFEPFTQVDGSSRREFGGTGLGLAISAQFVEMMGGDIWVVSDGRSGSTFHFTVRLPGINSVEIPGLSADREATKNGAAQTSSAAKERRSSLRFRVDDLATLTALGSPSPSPARVQVLNVSANGLKLSVGQFVDPGELVQIHHRDEIITAEVRYCIRAAEGFHIGIHYQNATH